MQTLVWVGFLAWIVSTSPASGETRPLQCTDGRQEVCTFCAGTACGEVPCVLLPLCDWVREEGVPLPRKRPMDPVVRFPLVPDWLSTAR